MTALVCDTSGLLAALDRSDPQHARCVTALAAHDGPLVLSPLVLAELDHLVRRRLGDLSARQLAEDVALGAYDLAPLDGADIHACLQLDLLSADLRLGLTDASLVVLADRVGTLDLLTLDERHFRAVRPLQGEAFRLWPADLRPGQVRPG